MSNLLLDRGILPDAVVRAGIRRLVAGRLREQEAGGPLAQARRFGRLLAELRRAPVAVTPDAANAQHYELPPAFFEHVLGPQLKYSCGWWPEGVAPLAEAEERMLAAKGRLDRGPGEVAFAQPAEVDERDGNGEDVRRPAEACAAPNDGGAEVHGGEIVQGGCVHDR